jgi:hypothetical protein
MSPIGNGSGAMSIYSTLNKLEEKEVRCAIIEIGCSMYSQRGAVQSGLHLVGYILLNSSSGVTVAKPIHKMRIGVFFLGKRNVYSYLSLHTYRSTN